MPAVKRPRIRQLREERGLSQDDLATRASLTQGAISLYESGERTPSMEVLGKIARALGVPPAYLLEAAAADPEIDLIVEDLRHLPAPLRKVVKDLVSHLRTIDASRTSLASDGSKPYGHPRRRKKRAR